MQLKNNIYSVSHKEKERLTGRFEIKFNPSCVICQAHFPGEPIIPGVCIVQIAKELMEDLLGEKMEIAKIKNVKFLSIISPMESTSVVYTMKKVEISEEEAEVKAQIVVTEGEEPKAKISLTCKLI